MSRFCSLFSSSKGNCTWLSGGGTAVLVDVGVSYRALTKAMGERGLLLDDLKAVFITHEHSDHIKGLRVLLGKLGLPVYASAGTLDYLCKNGQIPPGATLIECDSGVPHTVGDLEAEGFSTPHDACDPMGFRFTMPDERVFAVATDLGHVPPQVRGQLAGCDLVMLESNYDKGMLECSRYPYYLKRRIKSRQGHLSNNSCAEEITGLVKTGTTRLVLAHLSEENNMPAIAYETGKEALCAAGMQEGFDYLLKVAPARGPGELLIL